jgi:dTDP-4-dehydrorhamnose 3,5-epimerase
MRFIETSLRGSFIIEIEPNRDSRGFFSRTFCGREFGEHGLVAAFVQCSVSHRLKQGTLRDLHYQVPPACEVKLVRCTAGAIYDVIVDLRPDSPTYLRHVGVELTAQNCPALYIPESFAHGMQTLIDNTEVFYQISEFYAPGQVTGLRFNDPKLGIQWPIPITSISEKDMNWPLLSSNL